MQTRRVLMSAVSGASGADEPLATVDERGPRDGRGHHRLVTRALDAVYCADSRRILATLIRLVGDFDLAEEALHEAFRAALEQWPRDGIPANPRAWLVSAGRFKAIDTIRRRARFAALAEAVEPVEPVRQEASADGAERVEDDRLRLIFICCHPALSPDAQVALTLREVCGLTTEEIAHAFLTPVPTLAQRIVRAKAKIRDARIPYEVPSPDDLPGRLDSVLRVIYLVFNEGYSASSGGSLMRPDLSGEAIRLGRMLVELLPEPEAMGLLALMLLHESRRLARTTPTGDPIPLEEQDRSLWNRDHIAGGHGPGGAGPVLARIRALQPAGGDRGGARQRAGRRRDGLGPDRRPLRRAGAGGTLTRGRAESRRGRRDARRSCGWSRPGGRHLGARRPGGLSAGPPGPGGPVLAAWP